MGFQSNKWRYFRYTLEDRWHRMRLRERLDRNPRAVLAIAGGSVLLLVVMVVLQLIPREAERFEVPEKVWFYDLNTQELFQVKRSKLPPIEAPSGPRPDGSPAGVRAYVYEKPDGSMGEVAFLEMFLPEGKEAQQAYDPQHHDPNTWAAGRLCCRPNEMEWVAADSPEGRGLYREYYLRKNNIK